MNTYQEIMSTPYLNKLRKYNIELFDEMMHQYGHFQLGFFNNNDILFIGQNPGATYNTATKEATATVQKKSSFDEFEREYEKLIRGSKIGKYLEPIIKGKWDKVSFTNTVKVATEGNVQPSFELYELFFPILMKQIDLLEPKVIACLGKYAGAVFNIGKFYEAKRYKGSVVCMYPHPAYILRQGPNPTVNEQVRMKISLEELTLWSDTTKHEYEIEQSLHPTD